MGVKNPTGYSSCTKCSVVGQREFKRSELRLQKRPTERAVFLNCGALRSDETFRSHTDIEYHRHVTILEQLPIDMIRDFPIDPMHLLYLGVMKHILVNLLQGSDNKISPLKIKRLNKIMINIGKFTPDDFARKSRSFEDLNKFKATEFRQFLLYTGPVALRHIIPTEYYNHFMTLHVAIKILNTPTMCHEYNRYANDLLHNFVHNSSTLYGKAFVVHNVHNLFHIADDVMLHGSLENFSAFCFENYLRHMKTLIRGNAKPLQQIIKRISEIQTSDNGTVHNSLYKLRKTHNNGPLTSNLNFLKQYKHLDIGTIHLSTHSPNNAIILKDKRIGLVKNFLDNRGSPLLIVQFYQNVQDLYDIPISSSVLDIYSVSELSCDLFEVDIDLLETKLYLMPGFSDSEMAAFPISKFFHAENL